MMRQLLDTVSPANFPLANPEIIEKTARRAAGTWIEGAAHFVDDAVPRLAQEHRPVPEAFAIGKVLACDARQVVYRNDLMELIQYAPADRNRAGRAGADRAGLDHEVLHPRPLARELADPLARRSGLHGLLHLLAQPDRRTGGAVARRLPPPGILQALDVINAIVPGRKVHANGYCLGGTLLAIAAATMARDATTGWPRSR
jgi:polyhydroxyalkanoate synthase subunit PhaC